MNFFYSHLLHHYQELLDILNKLDIPKHQKLAARKIIDKTIHCAVIDILLDHVEEAYHERILAHINQMPDDIRIIELTSNLSGKNIEMVLAHKLTQLQMDILEDLTKY